MHCEAELSRVKRQEFTHRKETCRVGFLGPLHRALYIAMRNQGKRWEHDGGETARH